MNVTKQKCCCLWLASFIVFLFPSVVKGYEDITVANGGTISGFVKLQGKVPKPAPLQISKFKEVCRDVPDESLIVGPSQGVRYAVVTLEGVTKGRAIERETVHELDNVNCRFAPHVLAASVGQFLLLKNSDPILHTVHAYFKEQPQFNVGLYPGRATRKPLVAPGVSQIICEVHPWMSAYLVVADHPYFAVTDLYGEYEIRDVPPGSYRLKVWHEKLGVQEKQVEVKSRAAVKADFVLALPREVKK